MIKPNLVFECDNNANNKCNNDIKNYVHDHYAVV